MGGEEKNCPFMYQRRAPPIDTYLLRTLATIPSLGETKAQALLLNFKSKIFLFCFEKLPLIYNNDLKKKKERNSSFVSCHA